MEIEKFLKSSYELSEIQEIANGALAGGVSGFIYYSETIAFYDKHEREIWEMLEEDADSLGMSIPSLLDSFNVSVVDLTSFKNALCWYAVEQAARRIQDAFWCEAV